MPSTPIIEELSFKDAADGTVKTGKIKDTTYGVVEKGAAGLCPALPDENTTKKFLRQDGTWAFVANFAGYGNCTTAGSTAAKTVTIADLFQFSLEKGMVVAIGFQNPNTANDPTLNVNNTGAIPIFVGNSMVHNEDYRKRLLIGTVFFYYDGYNWEIVGGQDALTVADINSMLPVITEAELDTICT